MTSLAFNTKLNPFGAQLKVMMGSDIAHWDLPDMAAVLDEAYEMVEHGWIDEAAFREFVFTNPARSIPAPTPPSSRAPSSKRPSTSCLAGGLTCSICSSRRDVSSTEPGRRPGSPTSASETVGSR